jgi:hypothetical protein
MVFSAATEQFYTHQQRMRVHFLHILTNMIFCALLSLFVHLWLARSQASVGQKLSQSMQWLGLLGQKVNY